MPQSVETVLPDVEEAWIDLEDVRVRYQVAGEGDPILLIHGWPTNSHLWRHQMRALSADRRVYAIDLPGFGDSKVSEGYEPGISSYAATVLAFLDEHSMDKVALVGHDLGALVALMIAVQHPDRVDRLAILNTTPFSRLPWPIRPLPILAKWEPTGDLLTSPTGLRAMFRIGTARPSVDIDEMVRLFGGSGTSSRGRRQELRRSLAGLDLDEIAELELGYGSLTMPTLIVWGGKDATAPLSVAEQLTDTIPNAALRPILDAGHFVMEDTPDLVTNHLQEFLDGHGTLTEDHSPPERAVLARPSRLSGFRSEEGQQDYLIAYDTTLSEWPVPVEDRTVPTRYGRTHVLVTGPADGNPVVLLHADSLSSTQWLPNIGSLAEQHRVYAVDTVGEPGKSTQTRLFATRADFSDWLSEVWDGLELAQASLVGHSYGGWIALNQALANPDRIDKLVLLAPAASLRAFSRPTATMLRLAPVMWLIPTGVVVGRAEEALFTHPERVSPSFLRQFGLGVRHFRYPRVLPSVFTDHELQSLEPSTLLLVGSEEMIYNPSKAIARAKRLIPSIRAELITDAGHGLNFDQTERVNALILEFFGS